MAIHTFSKIFDGTERPSNYGKVTISYESLPISVERPTFARGYVYPVGSTAGRKSAPEPESNFRIGMTQTIPSRFTDLNDRNTGRPDMDKGHIIALELGGPDVPENIIPQWSQFQRNGEWRMMENEVYNLATKCAQLVMMQVNIKYVKNEKVSLARALTPVEFEVNLTEGITKTFVISNTRSDVDLKLIGRALDTIDPREKGDPDYIDLGPWIQPHPIGPQASLGQSNYNNLAPAILETSFGSDSSDSDYSVSSDEDDDDSQDSGASMKSG